MRRWLMGITGALILLSAVLYPLPTHGQVAAYNTTSHLAYCKTREYCLHELAHALDQRAGWISQTPGFQQAIEMYLYVELRKPAAEELPASMLGLTYKLDGDGWSTLRELYAFVFQRADGEVEKTPETLRRFYDWSLADHWMAELRPTQTLYSFP